MPDIYLRDLPNEQAINELTKLGFYVRDKKLYPVQDEISDDEKYTKLRRTDMTRFKKIEYSSKELLSCDFLEMDAVQKSGFPSPQRTWFNQAYDKSTLCPHCFAHAIQINSLKINSLPKKDRNNAFRLWWPFDIYVSKDVYEKIFELEGVGFIDINNKNGVSDKYIQLRIDKLVNLDVKLYDIYNICEFCSTIKYHPDPIPMFYRPIETDFDIACTNQLLGGGGRSSRRAIIISQRIYRKILDEDISGLIFKPCRAKNATSIIY